MQASSDCIPCMLEQALRMARRVSDDPWLQRKLLFAVMESLPTLNFDRTPAELSFDCLRFASKYLGVVDPHKDDKRRHTERLLAVENDLRRHILAAADPLRAAIEFALAAHRVDLDAVEPERVVEALVGEAGGLELALDDYERLQEALADARSVLYILSNAGEVVCDKLVIEQLGVPEIACVVHAAPVVNEATRADVEPVSLARLAKIVDIGVEALGVPLSLCSQEFRGLFADAHVVVSRGPANYETLEEAEREVFHVLQADCQHLATHFAVPTRSALLVRTPRVDPAARPPEGQARASRS